MSTVSVHSHQKTFCALRTLGLLWKSTSQIFFHICLSGYYPKRKLLNRSSIWYMIIINVWKTKGNKSGLSTLCQMFLQISLRTLQDFPECHENRAVPFGTPERSPSICKEISQEQSVLIVGWKLNLSITFSVPTSLSPICLSAGERENK